MNLMHHINISVMCLYVCLRMCVRVCVHLKEILEDLQMHKVSCEGYV